jgi:hypothetical protein
MPKTQSSGKTPVDESKSGSRPRTGRDKTKGVTANNRGYGSIIKFVSEHGQILDSASAKRLVAIVRREDTTSEWDARTPLFKRRPREEIIAEFDELYNTGGTLPEDFQRVLDDVEMGQRSKISPMSPYLAYHLDGPTKVERIMSDKPLSGDISMKYLEQAEDIVFEWIRPPQSIRQIGIKEAVKGSQGEGAEPGDFQGDGMDVSTNAGPPTYGRWYPSPSLKGDQLKAARIAWDYIINVRIPEIYPKIDRGELVDIWALVFKRLAQNDDPKKRKRIVIGPEKSWPIIGKTGSYPFIQWFRTVYLNEVRIAVALTNPYEIALDMHKMLEHSRETGNIVVSGDLANYDATIPPEMIVRAARVLARCMANPVLFETMGKVLAYRYNVITPTKVYTSQPSSMKSGDPFTNLFDSLVLLIVLAYGQLRYGYKIQNVSVQGDDFVVLGDGIEPNVIEQVFADFGLSANASKQLYEEGVLSFLQNLHFVDSWGGVMSAYRVLGRSFSYERMKYPAKDYSGYVDVVATLGRLENLWNHPDFEVTVDFLRSGDKFQLGAEMSPDELLGRSGSVGMEVLQSDLAASWKSGIPADGFSRMVVNEVLRGGTLPPQGSKERFLRALGHFATP